MLKREASSENYGPGGLESTFAPLVVLVINDNILCGWTNAFSQVYFRKFNHLEMAKGMEKWNPQNAKGMH